MRTWIYGDGYVVLRAPMDKPRRGCIWGDLMIISTEVVYDYGKC